MDEALAVLESFQPDVLVSDIAMPEKDGYDLIHEVRQREAETVKPILAIALTAYTSIENDIENDSDALSVGFQRYLAKPVKAEELIATVASLIQSTNRQSANYQSNYQGGHDDESFTRGG